MAEKYHVSDKTGKPAPCNARPGFCPVNRESTDEPETEHYKTKEEAQQAFESRNADREVASVSKKPVKSDKMKQLEKEHRNAVKVLKEHGENKVDLATNYFGEDPNSSDLAQVNDFLKRAKKIEFEENSVQKTIDALSNKIKSQKAVEFFDSNYDEGDVDFHDNKDAQINPLKFSTSSRNERIHYCTDARGDFNPATFEAAYDFEVDKGRSSVVILASKDGDEPKAILSSGEMYNEPDKALGKEGSMMRQENDDEEEAGTYVVGYVSNEGKRFGYVPNENIPLYVYK